MLVLGWSKRPSIFSCLCEPAQNINVLVNTSAFIGEFHAGTATVESRPGELLAACVCTQRA